MREILFKAKRKDNGEWVEGFVSRPFSKNTEGKITNYCFNALDEMGFVGECIVSADTICQYTGLTDKNGNKIWENDILEWEYENAPSDFFECVWLEDEIGFAFNNCKYRNDYTNAVDCYDEDYTDAFCMKVIGNIFDNPELLKGE